MTDIELPTVCWDACNWISLLSGDQRMGDGAKSRSAMCREVLEASKQGKFGIGTSTFSFVEVIKRQDDVGVIPDNERALTDVEGFFQREGIVLHALTPPIGVRAHHMILDPDLNIKPADTIHVATAQVTNALALHTFDKGLIRHSGKFLGLNGRPLEICMPTIPDIHGEGTRATEPAPSDEDE